MSSQLPTLTNIYDNNYNNSYNVRRINKLSSYIYQNFNLEHNIILSYFRLLNSQIQILEDLQQIYTFLKINSMTGSIIEKIEYCFKYSNNEHLLCKFIKKNFLTIIFSEYTEKLADIFDKNHKLIAEDFNV